MRLNIVTEPEARRWSLRYDAENLARHIDGAVVSDQVDAGADVNMFVNYALYEPVNTITTAMFTHLEAPGNFWHQTFFDVAEEVDHCFAMCGHTLEHLPQWKASIMTVWPSPQFYRAEPLRVGVCGRDYRNGRKRMHWVELIEDIDGLEIVTTGGRYEFEELPGYYDDLDYLLVISKNEGGPKPVVEALARGVPVIAPDVGNSWDFPVIRYDGTLSGLRRVLTGLVIPRDGWAKTAENVTQVHERLLRWRS